MAATELAVVGVGPAGLAAAVTAARAGVHVILIDKYPAPGGQYLKGTDHLTAPPPSPLPSTQAKPFYVTWLD